MSIPGVFERYRHFPSVGAACAREYRPGMDSTQRQRIEDQLEQRIRDRLFEAIKKDGRSEREIALAAGVNPDMVGKFRRKERWMDFRSLAPLCAVLGIDPAQLVAELPPSTPGPYRRMSGMMSAPVVDAGRYPMETDPEKRAAAIEASRIADGPNPDGIPGGHWVRIHELFTVAGDLYEAEDWVLVAPQTKPNEGDAVAAIFERRFVIALQTEYAGTPLLTVNGRPVQPEKCLVLGKIVRQMKRK